MLTITVAGGHRGEGVAIIHCKNTNNFQYLPSGDIAQASVPAERLL